MKEIANNMNVRDIENIDKMIKNIINKYISTEKIDKTKPLCLNIKFGNNENNVFVDDYDNILITNEKIYITLYVPCNLNNLRINTISNKIIVRTNDFDFYKEFWLNEPVIFETMQSSYKNNILEISFLKLNKSGPAQI